MFKENPVEDFSKNKQLPQILLLTITGKLNSASFGSFSLGAEVAYLYV